MIAVQAFHKCIATGMKIHAENVGVAEKRQLTVSQNKPGEILHLFKYIGSARASLHR